MCVYHESYIHTCHSRCAVWWCVAGGRTRGGVGGQGEDVIFPILRRVGTGETTMYQQICRLHVISLLYTSIFFLRSSLSLFRSPSGVPGCLSLPFHSTLIALSHTFPTPLSRCWQLLYTMDTPRDSHWDQDYTYNAVSLIRGSKYYSRTYSNNLEKKN